MNRLLNGIKNTLLWSYARGTWQYDILCLLIIGAVFIVPSSFFGDRDRPLQERRTRTEKFETQANEPHTVASKETGTSHQVIKLEELRTFLQNRSQLEQLTNNPRGALVLYLHDRFKRDATLERYEPQHDEQGRMIGYCIWFR
jgi:hypothetical protein